MGNAGFKGKQKNKTDIKHGKTNILKNKNDEIKICKTEKENKSKTIQKGKIEKTDKGKIGATESTIGGQINKETTIFKNVNCNDELTCYKKTKTIQREKTHLVTDQTLSHLGEDYLGHTNSTFQLNINEILTLNKEDLKYLEILGKGAFGVVQKAYDIRSCSYLALKYCQPKENQSLDEVWEEIGPEDDILKKIEEIKNPIFLKYFGIRKDPLCEKNMVLVMESGETTIDDILKANIHFPIREVLFILRELVNQFEILQQHGISNRDVKPANIIVVQSQANEYSFKLADFGIGCHIIESGRNQISIDDLKGCSLYFSAPEVKEINDDTYTNNSYDPFKGDVFSLGITLKCMLPPGPLIEEIETIISSMLSEKPENRISFKDLNLLLKSETYKKLIIQPSAINIKNYIELVKKNKDFMKTKKEKLKQYLGNAELYTEICHYKKVEEFVLLIESHLPEFLIDKVESNGEDELIAKLFFCLATFYKDVKQEHKKAEDFYEKVLKIKLQVFGEFHTETADIYRKLAIFYGDVKHDYIKAEDYYEKTLKIKLQVFGETHVETARIFENLAIFYKDVKKDNKKSEEYYQNALKIKLQVFGEMHAETANIYNNLAIFYIDVKQDYNKAEDYYEKALKIKLQVFGEMHGETAHIFENIAIFYNNVKEDYKRAENYYEKALKIKLQVFGETHAETANIYNNLAMFYDDVKQDYKRAEEYYEKALKIKLQVFGEMHVETAHIFENLAIFYEDVIKDYTRANDYYEKALKIRLNVFGEMHEETARIFENLAIFYQNVKKDYKRAEDYYKKALKIKLQVLGESHAETATTFLNFGVFMFDIKKESKEGIEMLSTGYNIRKSILGPSHSLTQKALETYNSRNK